jgi:hypothetical protein
MDSGATLSAMAKHLFRFLYEPQALRLNPLVSQYFQTSALPHPIFATERDAISRIHRIVLDAAEHCRRADVLCGKDERAYRQNAILTSHCVGRRPLLEVASALGISRRQCYRDRADICLRVARRIREQISKSPQAVISSIDEFQVFADHIVRQAELGNVDAALRESRDLLSLAKSPREKMEAYYLGVLVAYRLGDSNLALRVRDNARAFVEKRFREGASADRAFAQALVDLMSFRVVYHSANVERTLELARRATETLAQLQGNSSPRVRELYTDGLYALGLAFCDIGDLERGYEFIADAEATLPTLPATSSRLRARVTIEAWRLRSHLVLTTRAWHTPEERVRGLSLAFEQAYAAGWLTEAIAAALAVTEHYALAGGEDDALKFARLANVLSSRHSSARMRVHVPIRIAAFLRATRYAKYALDQIPPRSQLADCDAYHRELLSYVLADHALRRGAYREALSLSGSVTDAAENGSLKVLRDLVAATATFKLRRNTDAEMLIEQVVAEAERLGSAPTLRAAYTIAAKITGDVRFSRKSAELLRVLTEADRSASTAV